MTFLEPFLDRRFPDLSLSLCVPSPFSPALSTGTFPCGSFAAPEAQVVSTPLGTLPPRHGFAIAGRDLARPLLPPVGSAFFSLWPFSVPLLASEDSARCEPGRLCSLCCIQPSRQGFSFLSAQGNGPSSFLFSFSLPVATAYFSRES